MLYLNQLDYETMYYPTNIAHGGLGEGNDTVKRAGCGPCSVSMLIENMTLSPLPLEESVQMAMDLKANLNPGTDMEILGKAVAEKFNLSFTMTSDTQHLLSHLHSGGMAIANTGGDREGYKGVFSKGGHYILVLSSDENNTLCILDPSQTEDKYQQEGRAGKVKTDGHFVYCPVTVLAKDCANREISYYLFGRKTPEN